MVTDPKISPLDKASKKIRGRPKQEKGKNLSDRLLKYQDETLRFLSDSRVPFTNNLAEIDLRMIKVKEKISGSFASFKGGEIFCGIRSYISTLKKNNISVLRGLSDALAGKAYAPVQVGFWMVTLNRHIAKIIKYVDLKLS